MNYFNKLGIEEKYDIDLSELEDKYLEYQIKHHPDSRINNNDYDSKDEVVQLHDSIDINKAYKVLKSDISRAEHLLEIKGLIISDINQKPPKHILIEAFEDRQNLSSISSELEMLKIIEKTKNNISECKKKFVQLYQQSLFKEAGKVLLKMKYKNKLLQEIDLHLKKELA